MRTFIGWRFVALLVPMLLIACGDDNPSDSGNGGGTGNFGQFGSQISALYDQYIGSNQEGYSSLDALGPYITASLGYQPTPRSSPAPQEVVCFSSVAGTTYEFNGTSYVAGSATGAPDNGVRYVLYGLTGGQPNPADSIGYVEFRCTIVSTTQRSVGMTIVANGVGAFTVDGPASENQTFGSYNLSGFLNAPGVPSLNTTLYGQYNAQTVQLNTLFLTSDIQIEFGSTDSVTVGTRLIGAGALYYPDPNWSVTLRLHASAADEAIDTGMVLYSDNNTTYGVTQLVACVNGGTLSQPQLSAPSQSCNEFGSDLGPGLSAADQSSVVLAYQTLKSIHELFAGFAIAGFGIPVGPSS